MDSSSLSSTSAALGFFHQERCWIILLLISGKGCQSNHGWCEFLGHQAIFRVGASNPSKRIRQVVKDLCSAMMEIGEHIVTSSDFGKNQQTLKKVSSKLRESFPARYTKSGMFPTWKAVTSSHLHFFDRVYCEYCCKIV